jgi:uncharacterized protein (DUF3820 family)
VFDLISMVRFNFTRDFPDGTLGYIMRLPCFSIKYKSVKIFSKPVSEVRGCIQKFPD